MAVKIGNSVKIYPGVKIGKDSIICDFVVLGFPSPVGANACLLSAQAEPSPLQIGERALIRPFTTIYAGNKIGNDFRTGQGVTIRENNIIDDNVSVGTNTVLEFENEIGSGTRIHSDCFLELVKVESDVFIGPHTVFLDDPHPMNCPRYQECLGGVRIKKLAKIGGGCTILPGVTIGEHALVGAGSCVTKDVPVGTVVVGHPAKVIKKVKELKCKANFFEHPYEWEPYKENV